MPKDPRIKKVLVIGSGPIIIGQAAEFDYSGTQACRALKSEGVETILVNSNPATIMTDPDIADHVYIEPLTAEVIERIIEKEKPDAILPNLGGQMGLNLSMELARSGFLDRSGVRLLACKPDTIDRAEDRQLFKDTMEKLHQPIIPSKVVEDLDDALDFAEVIGYPVIVRPAFTMGGTGGGICEDREKLHEIATNGLRLSPIHQILVEKCISGWKEIEYEVMRDSKGNVITVCNMENLDPVGIHTGDSIVVAPSQTLSDKEYQMLRTAALDIITELGIEGGCNCQFALKPDSFEYAVIEVNPRVSRSSALASKATGYPIAKVATKIALGYTLDEITNDVTGETCACFEPALDYVVVKYPKWPFDKFVYADKSLGTQMMATGEVMAIGNNFEHAMMKAVSSTELGLDTMTLPDFEKLPTEEIIEHLHVQDSERVEKLYAAVDNKNFGPPGHIVIVLCADEDPASAFARVAPYAYYVHAKDFIVKPFTDADPGEGSFRSRGGKYLRGTIVGHGNVPIKQCMYQLKRAGYDDCISIEFEGMEPVFDALRIGLANLKKYWAEV